MEQEVDPDQRAPVVRQDDTHSRSSTDPVAPLVVPGPLDPLDISYLFSPTYPRHTGLLPVRESLFYLRVCLFYLRQSILGLVSCGRLPRRRD